MQHKNYEDMDEYEEYMQVFYEAKHDNAKYVKVARIEILKWIIDAKKDYDKDKHLFIQDFRDQCQRELDNRIEKVLLGE